MHIALKSLSTLGADKIDAWMKGIVTRVKLVTDDFVDIDEWMRDERLIHCASALRGDWRKAEADKYGCSQDLHYLSAEE